VEKHYAAAGILMPASLKVSSLAPDEIPSTVLPDALTVLEASSANSGR
jgi:hypothetical protein